MTGGAGDSLAVDANGRFDLETAKAYGKAMAPFNLKWYEEAGDPLDYLLQKELSDDYPANQSMATGENLFSMQDARNLIRYGGMHPGTDILQFDPALSYGLVEYLRTIDMLETNGWSRTDCVPHGGHLFALHIAAGLGLGGNVRAHATPRQLDRTEAFHLTIVACVQHRRHTRASSSHLVASWMVSRPRTATCVYPHGRMAASGLALSSRRTCMLSSHRC